MGHCNSSNMVESLDNTAAASTCCRLFSIFLYCELKQYLDEKPSTKVSTVQISCEGGEKRVCQIVRKQKTFSWLNQDSGEQNSGCAREFCYPFLYTAAHCVPWKATIMGQILWIPVGCGTEENLRKLDRQPPNTYPSITYPRSLCSTEYK